MSKSARSVLVFSVYLFVLGVGLVVIPNVLLSPFGFVETEEVWVRVVGMLVLILSFYYSRAARRGLTEFFRWTVYARSAVLVFFIAFVVLGLAPATLILFGVVDAAGALWTALVLPGEGST
jgi:uncharacterized protein YacL